MIDTRAKVCYDNTNKAWKTCMLATKEVNMAARGIAIDDAYTGSADFISKYKTDDGVNFEQKNKIEDYSTTPDPNKVFSVGGVIPPIIECKYDADPSLSCDMISLHAEGFEAETIAAFDALVTAGTISKLSVDKTDPTKPVIKFPADKITLTESKDGRGFTLTAGTGANTITVEVGAREISIKSSSGIDKTITHPTDDKTYTLELSKQLVQNCFDTTKTDRVIQTIDEVAGTPRPIKKFNDLSPELAAALAQTAKPAATKTHGKITYGNFDFVIGYDISGFDSAGAPTTNDVILVKDNSDSKLYLLHSGSFREVKSTTLAYGNRTLSTATTNIEDIGVCFKIDSRTTIELPIHVPTKDYAGATTYTKNNKNTLFLNEIINFTQDASKITAAPTLSGAPGDATINYHGIDIAYDDGAITTRPLLTSIDTYTADIAAPAAAAPDATGPGAGSAGDSDGKTGDADGKAGGAGDKTDDKSKKSDKARTATTTKKISGLDKIVKAFGQLGLMTGFFLFVGAVLMPALLPAAIGVLAAGAGLYLGSNLVAGNFDITLNKMINDQTAREAKRKKDHKKFMKLETKLEAANNELATLENEETEYQRLCRLDLGGTLTPPEVADLNNLRALKARGMITDADQEKLDFLERLDRGSLSATELADFNTLDAKRTSRTLTDPAEIAKLNTLDRLKRNGSLTPTEISDLAALDAKVSAHTPLTPAESAQLNMLHGHLSPDKKNRMTALGGRTASDRHARIADLKDKCEKLENKGYMFLANADFKTIESIKAAKGAQAEKDEEHKLRAAFEAAHATTPATPDEIKQFDKDLPAKKEAARVAAEKDFISKNEYSITRNIMKNARGKDTKQFIANLSNDERSYITGAADDIDTERLRGTKTAKITGSDIAHPTRTSRIDKVRYAARDKSAKSLESKLSKAPSTHGSPSYKTTWLKTFITRHEGYEKAKEALDAAGASDSKLKAWATARKIFNDEMGKSRDARILESTRASATAKAKAQTRIQTRRNKAGIDTAKFNNPEDFSL